MQIGLGLWLGTRQVGDGSSLNLNFLSGSLDSRITFTRTTTATVVGSNGLVQSAAINAPRFDYDPVTLAPRGILIEEQRTNLLLRSEEFDNAAWSKSQATVTVNAAVSPDGTSNADALIPSTVAATAKNVSQNPTYTAVAHTLTVYAKPAGYGWIYLREDTSGSARRTYFNISAGTVGTISAGHTATITSVGNGWYRCAITFTAVAGAFATAIFVTTADNASTMTGDGTSGIFIWGAQLEVGAFATSYIPTVASQVTRTADQASIVAPMFAPWYNQTEGTFVAEFASPVGAAANAPRILAASDGTANNRIRAFLGNTNTVVQVSSGNVLQATLNNTPTTMYGVVNKLAFAVKASDFAASINGGTVATVASGTVPSGINRLDIGSDILGIGLSQINGHIRSIKYFPTRLSNDQLQALTV